MEEILAVFLDAGGVFHLPSEEGVRQALAEVGHELDANALERAHYLAMVAYDRGGFEGYPAGLAQGLGVSPDLLEDATSGLTAFFKNPGGWAGLIAQSIAALPAIAATGVKLAVVSNADGSVERRLAEEGIVQVGPGRGTPVAAVIDSSVVGVAKPDPRIFEPALSAVGVPAANAVHVGDSVLADVGGARAAGIRPVHLDPFGDCAETDHEHLGCLKELVGLIEASRVK